MAAWTPEDALAALMDRFARPCIRLHRPFPPPCAGLGRSKLGGLPNLPPGLEWPRGKSGHRTTPRPTPLHFMAQIDCSELPRIGDLLPASGMLFVFANMNDASAWDSRSADDYRRVLYAPQVAPDQAVRPPPPDLPQIEPRTSLNGLPHGYSVGHRPGDPLTGRIYFEFPLQFAVIDTYPDADAVRETEAWAELSAFWAARARADTSFREHWGDESGMRDAYQEMASDRMAASSRAALNVPRHPGPEHPPALERWRELERDMQFPPVAAYVSETAAAIDHYLEHRIAEDDRLRRAQREQAQRDATPPRPSGLRGLLDGLFGTAPPPPPAGPPSPAPAWHQDIALVRQDCAGWLKRMRALAPDHPLTADERAAFLAWLDDLHDGNWMRSKWHKPELLELVDRVVDRALFRLCRLAVADPVLRAQVPDSLYALCDRIGFQVGAWHQMLGWFGSSQAARAIDDPAIPLLMLAWDSGPDFQICDVGEMQVFIAERDLRARDFSKVEVQMQGG